MLIALSACAYGVNRPWMGVTFGLAAIFVRELALPYVVVCVAIAWWQGRRSELLAWSIGLLAWVGFFGLHWWRVTEVIAAGRTPINKAGSSLAGPASSLPRPK